MRSWAMLLFAGLFVTMSGCCVFLENTDPFENPVQVEFDVDPKRPQPNPGILNAGFAVQLDFPTGTTRVTAVGFDTEIPEITDTISVSLPLMPECRHVEWDGFQFIDRGVITPSALGRIAAKKISKLFKPGADGIITGNPNKPAVAP